MILLATFVGDGHLWNLGIYGFVFSFVCSIIGREVKSVMIFFLSCCLQEGLLKGEVGRNALCFLCLCFQTHAFPLKLMGEEIMLTFEPTDDRVY